MKEYNYATIRKLVDAAFGDEDLTIFCHDHFVNVYDGFTAGQTKGQRLLLLVEHVRKHGLTDKLLREIAGANPHQYNLFKSRIKDDVSVSAEDEPKGKTQPAEEKREKIRFLHLSDLHLTSLENKGPAEAFNQDIVTGSLVKSVGEMDLAPDFIVITGDIARTGKAEEYKVCEVFLKKLLEASGLNRDRLFLTPGNHDVDRGNVTQRQIKSFYHFEDQDEVTEILSDPDICPILMRKFENFNLFSEKALNRPLFDDAKFWFAETLSLRKNGRDYSIKVVGLNSCLFAGYDGDDRQNLSLGLFQVGPVVESRGETVLSVGFFHHPFSCFHPSDKVCQNLLVRNFDMILTGHLHDPSNAFVRNAAGRAVIIGAGAGFETRESRNSFNVTEIDPETGEGTTQFYKYLPDFNLWKKDTDVNPDTDDGCFSFSIAGRDGKPSSGSAVQTVDKSVASDTAEDKERRMLRAAYLKRVLWDTGVLSLEGIDPKAAGDEAETRMSLGSVYTALLTVQGKDPDEFGQMLEIGGENDNRKSALDMLNEEKRLVLLGDPGSGKTTFVNFAAMCMVGELSGEKEANLDLFTRPLPDDEGRDKDERQPWDHGALIPVRVVLRDFAARGLPEKEKLPSASDLWSYISGDLESAALGGFAPHLHRELMDRGGLVLLDGLDEVPDAEDRRLQIKNIVEDFMKTFHRCRVLVTSRTYAYQKQEWRISGMAEAVLAPFPSGQIRRFVDRWYSHVAVLRRMDAEDAAGRAELLKQSIFGSRRLMGFAERPLLLTLMASLHAWRGGTLPERREELYADTLDLLLEWWEGSKVKRNRRGEATVREPSLSEWLKTDRDKVRRLLSRLAFEAHEKQEDMKGTADIPESDLITGLLGLSDNPDIKPKQLVNYMSQRAGLLIPRGVGVYTFPHRTFQEYLAACYLTDEDYPDRIAELARSDPNRWREVALLAGAKAGRGSEFGIWALANALCYRDPDDDDVSESDIWGGRLAGQLLSDTLIFGKISASNQHNYDRIRKWLLHIINDNEFPIIERVTAGNNLSRLGDPRFNPEIWYLSDDEDFGFVTIPAGTFMMGSEKEDVPFLEEKYGKYPILENATDDENEVKSFTDKFGDSMLRMPIYRYEFDTPRHEVFLPEYHISRYPVTKAQYQVFVERSGYKSDNGWRTYGEENHPVVMVSLYDAVAYCDWLTEKFKDRGFRFRLPTEAEWEKASGCEDGRVYPWGGEPDPNRMNCDATGLGQSSTVGCFPGGVTSYRVIDLIGNVWEWTLSLWGKHPFIPDYIYPYLSDDGRENLFADPDLYRVVRGGSWYVRTMYCRSAARFKDLPSDRYMYVGFRLVRLPIN